MSTSPVAPVAPFPLPLKQGDYISYHGSVLYADPTPDTKAECFVPVAQCESEEYAAYLCAAANAYQHHEACLAALRRAIPWLGKLIADGGHLNSVAPNDAIGALQQAEAALALALKPSA